MIHFLESQNPIHALGDDVDGTLISNGVTDDTLIHFPESQNPIHALGGDDDDVDVDGTLISNGDSGSMFRSNGTFFKTFVF